MNAQHKINKLRNRLNRVKRYLRPYSGRKELSSYDSSRISILSNRQAEIEHALNG